MRKQIAQESTEPYIDGRVWMPGCFTWDPEKTLWVVSGNNFADIHKIVGEATDLRREEDGKITAEIKFQDDISIRDPTVSVYGNGIRYETGSDGWSMKIHEIKIRELFVTIAVPWSPFWDEERAREEL